jgi:pantoate--beta-alanine ligase
MALPPIAGTVAELRRALTALRAGGAGRGEKIALVPTLGALHPGHLSLVTAARTRAAHVVVSIFVNPTQFAPHEDFGSYPRTLEADRALLGDAADLIFAPTTAEMYPDGFATTVSVKGPSAGLETDFRPHFFDGVATVVAKLLIAAAPDIALFGEKDYQQLLVVRRLVRDLDLPIEIVAAPILREADGLAMSSRNAYLTPPERAVAARLNRVLTETIARLRGGEAIADAETFAIQALKDAGFDSVDYVALRDAQTLTPAATLDKPARLLVAAKIGRTRLIDNMAVD